MIRALAAAMVITAAAAPAAANPDCPHPAALGQVVLPSEPCPEITAEFSEPTSRYPHAVLGDDEEYTLLSVTKDLTTIRAPVTFTRVFEDLHPRLADIDGKPGAEIIVVESERSRGAALVVYSVRFGSKPKLTQLAATRTIGQRFRWLAPIGMADFDGDGQNDIAYVETPHLGKILRIVTLRDGALVEIASEPGYSNHRIGEDFISGGVRDCAGAVEAVTADAAWRRVIATRLDDGRLTSTDLGPFEGPESFARALSCS